MLKMNHQLNATGTEWSNVGQWAPLKNALKAIENYMEIMLFTFEL